MSLHQEAGTIRDRLGACLSILPDTPGWACCWWMQSHPGVDQSWTPSWKILDTVLDIVLSTPGERVQWWTCMGERTVGLMQVPILCLLLGRGAERPSRQRSSCLLFVCDTRTGRNGNAGLGNHVPMAYGLWLTSAPSLLPDAKHSKHKVEPPLLSAPSSPPRAPFDHQSHHGQHQTQVLWN
jgi:hypothetical protein